MPIATTKSHTLGKVSVVVTAYNHRQFIRPCLNSIKSQSYPHWELIIVDDASTDGTREVITDWLREQTPAIRRRTRLIRFRHNAGYARALSAGLRAARGRFVALQDSDDLSHPNRLRQQVQFLHQHRTVGLVGTSYRVISRGRIDPTQSPLWLKFGSRAIREHYAAGGHCICVGTLMLRRPLIARFGGPTGRIKGAEDYEFVAKMIGAGIVADNLRAPLYLYRAHRGQRSRTYYGK